MLTLPPSAVTALATFLRAAPDLQPLPPTIRKRAMTDDELLAYETMPVVVPSGADPIHATMIASTPDDWVGMGVGVVDVSQFFETC